jgi:hypothetical protein
MNDKIDSSNFAHFIDYMDCNKLFPIYKYSGYLSFSVFLNKLKKFSFFSFFSWTNELIFDTLDKLHGFSKEEGHSLINEYDRNCPIDI